MECKEFLELLSGRIDGENSAEEERLLQRHLTSCARCRACLADYEAMDRMIADLAVEPPEGLAERIMAQVRAPAKKRRFIFGGGTLAAVIALAIILPGLHSSKSETPAIEVQSSVSDGADEAVRQRVRSMDAQFAAAEEPLLIEITDDADFPAVENIAALAELPYVVNNGNPEFYIDAAAAREIIQNCDRYAAVIPDELADAADDAPCVIRIVESK